MKYKKSELFDNEYSKQEKIPEITNKVNEKNYNKQFEPQYSKLTAFERYQKQMGNDPEIYNAYNKYIKDFYGKNI